MSVKQPDDHSRQDAALVFIKGSRILTYIIYGYALVASAFLSIGFLLLLFSANAATPFVNFVYTTGLFFLTPFRGIFPVRAVSETGYFSASALFAIIMYLLLAVALHALINYLTSKMVDYSLKLDKQEDQLEEEVVRLTRRRS